MRAESEAFIAVDRAGINAARRTEFRACAFSRTSRPSRKGQAALASYFRCEPETPERAEHGFVHVRTSGWSRGYRARPLSAGERRERNEALHPTHRVPRSVTTTRRPLPGLPASRACSRGLLGVQGS